MKILLGVDTSPHAHETVALLCRMSWPAGTSILVLSVVAPSEPQYVPLPHVLAATAQDVAVIEARQLETHEQLIARMEDTLRRAGFEAKGEIGYGDPRHVLVETARSRGVDFVVVGSHGHRGIGGLAMGSVASYVVTHAPCSVLVVRKDNPEIGR
jgi:nucleotide-binding universal stress UspA family protein